MRQNKNHVPDKVIANNIKRICAEQNISQSDLGAICGKSFRSAHHWIHGASTPSAEDIKKICVALHLSADELLGIKRSE